MKIVGSQVTMKGVNKYTEEVKRTESMRIWQSGSNNIEQTTARDSLALSDEALNGLATASKGPAKVEGRGWEISDKDKKDILILMAFFKALTGKDIKFNLIGPLGDPAEVQNEQMPDIRQASQGWGMTLDIQEIYREEETMSFSAGGFLRTADGQEISFQVELQLAREYRQETNIHLQFGDAPMADPLVINFAGGHVGLAGGGFKFNLNGDNEVGELPYLEGGSGYLVFDRNGNDRVDDGSELFGPATGQGFSELAAFDEDKNGWIDEGDSIFTKLKIWLKTSDGEERLLSLREVGIGALLVEGLDLEFTYKDANNQSLARNRSTGIFIKEDGTAGTIQQLDVKV